MIQAMIFAAGLGTRLQPLTNNMPKALIEVGGTSLLEHAVRHLAKYDIKYIVVNVHHFSHLVIEKTKELEKKYNLTILISDESDKLLETGGGLKKAANFFKNDNSILLYNSDIITNLNLKALLDYHNQQKPLATLSVKSRKTSRYFLFNEKMELCGWKNMQNNEIKIACSKIQKLKTYAFSGIQIVSPDLLLLLESWRDKFSITDVYIKLCPNYRIIGLYDSESFWIDVGTPEKLNEANQLIKSFAL